MNLERRSIIIARRPSEFHLIVEFLETRCVELAVTDQNSLIIATEVVMEDSVREELTSRFPGQIVHDNP